jgi:hypothetical protein
MGNIECERTTANACFHDVSRPSSRAWLISYKPIPAKGPMRANPDRRGKIKCGDAPTTKPDPDERVDETQKNEVRRFRREIIETFGQSVLEATLLGVSRPYLGRVLSGEKPITAGIIERLRAIRI